MNRRTLGASFGVALALIFALSATQPWVSAQANERDIDDQEEVSKHSQRARKIEGVWDVLVSRRDCQTGHPSPTPPNRVMNMFIRGGTLMETGGRPTTRGPGLGTWQHLGGRRYSAVFRFFRFNTDGSSAGSRKVTRTIELSRDANEFTATASDELFDADDNLIQTGLRHQNSHAT